jgi:hypothetical protein
MNMLKDIEKFVSNVPNKTPPMTVQVIDNRGQTAYTYDAPAGFQLERYVQSIFPKNAELMVTFPTNEFNVSVFIPGEVEPYQIHVGRFNSPLSTGNVVS